MADNVVAYGFTGLEALFANRVADTDIRVIETAIEQTAAEYNRQMNEVLATLSARTTEAQTRYNLPGTGTLQPVDEWGNPRPTRPGGYYTVAFPIQGAGDAFGTNRITRALITVGELNRQVIDVQNRDADWVRRHALAALLDNGTWTYDDPEHGNLTIQPLANGDTVVYPRIGGQPAATAQHYLAQAADILDASNPFPTLYTLLRQYPGQRNSRVVSFVASDLVADIKALATFNGAPDPDITTGADSDRLTGPLPDVMFGDVVVGKADGVWIVEWSAMPSGYMLTLAVDADRPLAMREYPAASLQGLFREEHSPNGNVLERRWLRFAGFGARNRTAAAVTRIGDAAYATPTGYSTPLAV